MKVKQFISKKSGRPIPNQFIIRSEGRFKNDVGQFKKSIVETLQSYDSIIARITYKGWDEPIIELDEYFWDYSRTTVKYRNQFLNTNTQEINKMINSGIIKLKNLNS
jgi:hypothetical protein